MVYGELIHQGWRLAANEFVVVGHGDRALSSPHDGKTGHTRLRHDTPDLLARRSSDSGKSRDPQELR